MEGGGFRHGDDRVIKGPADLKRDEFRFGSHANGANGTAWLDLYWRLKLLGETVMRSHSGARV